MKYILLIVLFLVSSCSKKIATNEIFGLVTFFIGDVKIEEKKISLGTKIKLGEKIKTGNKSICDIQILGLESQVNIRIRENSEFILKQEMNGEKNSFNPILKLGSAFINVSKLKQNESLSVYSPVNVAGVRGTSFELNITKDTSLSVFEGSIANKKRIPDLESIPTELIEKIPSLKILNELISKEEILTKKEFTTISFNQDSFLKELNLFELIKHINSELADKKDFESILKSSKEFESKIDLNKVKAFFEKTKPNTQNISDTTLEEKLKEATEMIILEKENLNDESKLKKEISNQLASKKELILKRLESVLGKKLEELKLKNGNLIKGIIYQENGKYKVVSPDGILEFNETEVEGVSF